jgi:HSP20 family protein
MLPSLRELRRASRRPSLLDELSSTLGSGFTLLEGGTPRANIEETSNSVVLEFDLPGIKKSDVEITYGENFVTVTGERYASTPDEGDADDTILERIWKAKESYYGKLSRTVTVGALDFEKAKAKLQNGVLKITIPRFTKATEGETNKIPLS